MSDWDTRKMLELERLELIKAKVQDLIEIAAFLQYHLERTSCLIIEEVEDE